MLDAYFVVERYVDQLDDEEMANNTVVIPRTVEQISAPQITTYGSFGPSYPFSAPGQAFGNNIAPGSAVPGLHRAHDGSNNV